MLCDHVSEEIMTELKTLKQMHCLCNFIPRLLKKLIRVFVKAFCPKEYAFNLLFKGV